MPVSPRQKATVAPTAWIGWYRERGGSWQQLVTASDEDACWRQLLDTMTRHMFSGDWCVLKAGEKSSEVNTNAQ